MTAVRAWPMLIVLLLVNILNFVDRQLPFILAESIKRDLGLSDTQLGLLTGLAFAICYSLAALPMARLADLWSPKKVMLMSIGLWSAMTALGGSTVSFLQLALTRTGVALGEAGGTPSAHAIIARTLPPGLRGKAIGVFAMGAPIGTMLGMAFGGWIADVSDWRTALLIAGLAGFAIAALVAIVVPRGGGVVGNPVAGRSTIASLRHLFGSRAYRWLFAAMCLIGMCGYPFLAFTAPYLIRIHALSTAQAGLFLGLVNGLLGIAGTVLGGAIFDRAIRASTGNILIWPTLALLIAAPLTLAAYFAGSAGAALVLLIPMGFAITFYTAALYGSAHLIAGAGHEATASSVLIIGAGLVGGSIGPVAVGVTSDWLAPSLGVQSLRWALILVPALALLAGGALYRANRHVARHLNDTRLTASAAACSLQPGARP